MRFPPGAAATETPRGEDAEGTEAARGPGEERELNPKAFLVLDEAGNPIRPFEPTVARTLNLAEPNPDGVRKATTCLSTLPTSTDASAERARCVV